MKLFVTFGANGKIVNVATSTHPTAIDGDFEVAEFPVGILVAPQTHYIAGGEPVKLPEQPSNTHTFNWQTKQWEDLRTLQDLKDAKWTQIKQARSQAEYAGFTWDGSTFDSNAISQQRISNAVQLAVLDPAFSITWTLADNTARVLSGADMLAVGRALGDHVATQHAKAQALRGQIEAASTAGEVEAVRW